MPHVDADTDGDEHARAGRDEHANANAHARIDAVAYGDDDAVRRRLSHRDCVRDADRL
jgi:hypothetical protein